MTAIPPAPASPPRGSSPKGSAIAVVEHASVQAGRFASGTVLTGTVMSREQGGRVRVETDRGVLVLRTTQYLSEGTAVRMQIQIVGNQMRAVIISSGAQPGSTPPDRAGALTRAIPAGSTLGPEPPVQGTRSGDTVVSTSTATRQAASLAPGAVVVARLLPTHPTATSVAEGGPPAFAPTASPPAAGGSVITIRLIDVLPASWQSVAPGASAAAEAVTAPRPPEGLTRAPGATRAVDGAHPGAPPPSPAAISEGAAARATYPNRSMAPATAQNAAIAPAAPPPGGPMMAGTVTHVPGAALPALATPIGQLVFPGIGALPAQSIVRFEVVPAGAAFAAAPAARIPPPATPIELSRQWPALGRLLEALGGIEPAAAAALSEAIIPKPGVKLSQAVLFFLSALRLGNIESWLGAGTVDRLRAGGKGHILSTIGEEFRRLSRVAADPGTGEWRACLVPLYDGDRLEQLRFFHRRRGDAEGVPAEEHGDRFLIDLQLSRLGQMQLDGLLRGKRFSLVLRSATALTPEARRDIADIFQDGCACTGLSGDLVFTGAGEFVPLPVESLAVSSKGLSV